MNSLLTTYPVMYRIHRIHFIGIGGIGMCGIAEVLLQEGYQVTGSDLAASPITERLQTLGATISIGHHVEHVKGADVVVYSSAVRPDNVELAYAQEARIPIIPRAEMLAELMRFRSGIAIAGTHGKTTTTSLVTSLLMEAGLDPSFVIGGRLNSSGTTARLGKGQYLVVEADESDASFLRLKPLISVVTNIDEDHMDTYHHSVQELQKTFVDFLHQLPFYGLAVVCYDDPGIQAILPRIARRTMTYGFQEGADVRAVDITQKGLWNYFTVYRPEPYPPLSVELNLAGEHNVLNALAVVSIAMELKISDEILLRVFKQFAGIGRRFQQLGFYQFQGGRALVIDDYGHHPKKILATIKAARRSWPDRQIAMIFQPHRYTRTRDLFSEFAQVLSEVDKLLLLEIYSAGEDPIEGVTSEALYQAIKKIGKNCSIFIKNSNELSSALNQILVDQDILLSQGAGSVSAIVKQLLEDQKDS